MKTLARVVLGIWILIIGGALVYFIITKPESVFFGALGFGILLFLVFAPFWALDELSKR